MTYFIELFVQHFPYILCYGSAIATGLVIAVVELLSRYGAGNHPNWVLSGQAQTIYYLVNMFSACMGLFVSETLGETEIISHFNNDISLSILKSFGIGFASMMALRSSVFSIKNKDDKDQVDVGPAYVVNLLNRYLERQIDHQRGTNALKEVREIMQNFDPDYIDPDLTSICLSIPESIPKEDLVRLRKDLDVLFQQSWKTPKIKSVAMGIQIQKEVGSKVLKEAVNTLNSLLTSKTTESRPDLSSDNTSSNLQTDSFSGNELTVLESVLIDEELDKQILKIRGGQ